MTDLEWQAAQKAYLFAPHGKKKIALKNLQAITKRLLKPGKKRKR